MLTPSVDSDNSVANKARYPGEITEVFSRLVPPLDFERESARKLRRSTPDADSRTRPS